MLSEDVCQLEEGRVDEDGEGVPLEEPREADDGLALESEYILSRIFGSILLPTAIGYDLILVTCPGSQKVLPYNRW